MDKIRDFVEQLPVFLKPIYTINNRDCIEFDNASKILCMTTNLSSFRGLGINFLYIEEIDSMPTNIMEDFFANFYPAFAVSSKCNVVSFSTPEYSDAFRARNYCTA